MEQNTEKSTRVANKKTFSDEEQAILRACLNDSDIAAIGQNAANNAGKSKAYSAFSIMDALRGARRNFAIEVELRKQYELIIKDRYNAINKD